MEKTAAIMSGPSEGVGKVTAFRVAKDFSMVVLASVLAAWLCLGVVPDVDCEEILSRFAPSTSLGPH